MAHQIAKFVSNINITEKLRVTEKAILLRGKLTHVFETQGGEND